MQLLTYETMSENIDMTDATYCKSCSLWKTYVCTLPDLQTCLCVTFNIWHRFCRQIPINVPETVYTRLLTYNSFSLYNLWHTKPCLRIFDRYDGLWYVVPPKRRASMHLLTYKTSSRVNFHIGVLSQLSCIHTNVSSTRRVDARVHRIKDGYLHTFWLSKTCLRVQFNISHRVLHLTSHCYTWNDVKPRKYPYLGPLRAFCSLPIAAGWELAPSL